MSGNTPFARKPGAAASGQHIVDVAIGERGFDGEIVVDAPLQNARLGELHEAIHDHLARAIKPALERSRAADFSR